MWAACGRPARLQAQGITTATIRGTVSPGDAEVRVVNEATGFPVKTQARNGRFVVPGLEVGGPYTVLVRGLGFAPQVLRGRYLRLGETLELDLRLQPLIASVDTVRVITSERTVNTATTIPEALLHRLPTLSHDMYDFVRLAPQVSTKIGLSFGGISAAGMNVRFDNYLIDGATDRVANGNSAWSSVPLDAVREYQVLLAPFDVRFGDFAGALVNSVTKAGTNEFHADGFVFERNEQLARATDSIRGAPYQRTQFGFTASGPLVRDRLHFLIATEALRLTKPAPGPFLGQAPGASPAVPVSDADVARFSSILGGYGLDAGSGGAVAIGNRTANVFTRLDLALPAINSRAVLLGSYQGADPSQLSRVDTFSLSSYRVTQANSSQLASAQLHTNLRGGGYNALTLSLRTGWSELRPEVRAPLVIVQVPSVTGGTEMLKAGSQEGGQGVHMASRSIALGENLTVPVGGSHQLVVGGQAEFFRLQRGGVNGGYGTWTFANLDSLEHGVAERYQVRKDFGSAALPLRGAQYALYVGDEWRAGDRLSVTFGLRADALALLDHAPYNGMVDSIFGRRTDVMPETRVLLSPRLGFNWDVSGTGRDRVRGGAGVFTGRYPLGWAHSAVYSNGSGIGSLRCGPLPTDSGPAPAFVPDYRAAPTACANGKDLATAPLGDVDLLDRRLRMAQAARLSLAWDRRLPWDVTATAEALITRNISDVVFVNLNLKGPQGTDQHGRVMYGKVSATGVATAETVSGFSEVIDAVNVSSNHSFQVDARLEKRFSRGFAASASYTFTRVRDVQLPTRAGMRGFLTWSGGRAVSGRHDDLSTGISLYDIPHRVVIAGTVAAPWRRLATEFSLYYVAEAGSPFTYVAGGAGQRGDLNADGAVGNDPFYVPTSASDTGQIRFSGLSDAAGADTSAGAQAQRIISTQQAFEQFIASTACLRSQRGQIMRRNSCREPWSHTSIASLRQTIPLAGHTLTLHLDVYNVLDLLGSGWGQYRVANPVLLSQVGQTPGALGVAQPVFRFDAARPRWNTVATESAYQLQLAVRYGF